MRNSMLSLYLLSFLLVTACSHGVYKNQLLGYKIRIPHAMVMCSSLDQVKSRLESKTEKNPRRYFEITEGADVYFCNPQASASFNEIMWIVSEGAGFDFIKLRDPDYETVFLQKIIENNGTSCRIYQAGFETIGKRKVYRVDFVKDIGSTELFMTRIFLPNAFYESHYITAVYSREQRKKMVQEVRNMVASYKR